MPPGFKQGAPCLGNHLLFTTVAIHGLRHALFPIHRRLARPVSSLSSICVRRRQRQLPLLLSHYATKERIREKERAAAASRQLFGKQKGGRRLRCAKLIKDVFSGSYRFHATRRLGMGRIVNMRKTGYRIIRRISGFKKPGFRSILRH